MSIGITAIGVANPPYCQTQAKLVDFMTSILNLNPTQRRRLSTIYQASGINTRYSVLEDFTKKIGELSFFPNNNDNAFPSTLQRMLLYKKHALPLALSAIRDCFKDSDQDFMATKMEITHLITISCTGMYAPGLDIDIIQALRISPNIERTAINFMGCYGVFNGLKLAKNICLANRDAKVLIVSLELCSLHFQQKVSLDNLISSAVFSDGSGALLVQANPNKCKYFSLDHFFCDLLKEGNEEMTWDIGNEGFNMRLSNYVARLIESGIKNFSDRLLSKSSSTLKNIHYYAIHPGGRKILEALEKALAITLEDNRFSYEVLKKFGNMSSATIVFVLKAIWQNLHKEDNLKNIFSCAFGPGLTLESMLLSIRYV